MRSQCLDRSAFIRKTAKPCIDKTVRILEWIIRFNGSGEESRNNDSMAIFNGEVSGV